MDAASETRPPVDPDRCTQCGNDLSDLAEPARFCPICGQQLSAARGTADPRRPSTLVVRGYSSAMFKLGERYEVRHNDDEAVRCYDKASRLGNRPARRKLFGIPFATPV